MDNERKDAIAALQARRAARGMSDPLNRLRAYVSNAEPIAAMECPHCSADGAARRVTLHTRPWAGSPDVWLGGQVSDLQILIAAGMAERLPNGWYVPTEKLHKES